MDRVVSVERDTFPNILEKGNKVGVFKHSGYWIDLGNLEKYKQVHLDMLNRKCRLQEYSPENEKIVLGQNIKIHSTARLLGSVYIGDNVEIGPKAIVRNSVIGNDSFIGYESRIMESILWNNVRVSSNARLKKTIVPANSIIRMGMNYSDAVFTADAGNLYLQKHLVL